MNIFIFHPFQKFAFERIFGRSDKYIRRIIFFSILFAILPQSIEAQARDLIVEFEQTPLFTEANFLPGDTITRFIKLKNESNRTQTVAVEFVNVNDPYGAGGTATVEIREGGIVRYHATLLQASTAGIISLSTMESGEETQYDFSITFHTDASNTLQGKPFGFDMSTGFLGGEMVTVPILSVSGGGMGFFTASELTISEESIRVVEIGEMEVTITWSTSQFGTSQVIYSSEGESHELNRGDTQNTPPRYGYMHTTLEYDIDPRVSAHSVTVTGLVPGTTYYYRTVSRASPPAISREYTFTTLGRKQTGKEDGASGVTEMPQDRGREEQKQEPVTTPVSQEQAQGDQPQHNGALAEDTSPGEDISRSMPKEKDGTSQVTLTTPLREEKEEGMSSQNKQLTKGAVAGRRLSEGTAQQKNFVLKALVVIFFLLDILLFAIIRFKLRQLKKKTRYKG